MKEEYSICNMEEGIILGKIKTKTLHFDIKEKTLYVKDITSFIMRSFLYALNMGMYYNKIEKIVITKQQQNNKIENGK